MKIEMRKYRKKMNVWIECVKMQMLFAGDGGRGGGARAFIQLYGFEYFFFSSKFKLAASDYNWFIWVSLVLLAKLGEMFI